MVINYPLLLPGRQTFSSSNTCSVFLKSKRCCEVRSCPSARHEVVWRSGCRPIAQLMLNLGTVWRWGVSFTPRPLYARERSPGTHQIGSCVGPRAAPDVLEYRKMSCPSRQSHHGLSVSQPVAWAVYRLSYPGPKIRHNHSQLYVMHEGV